MQTTPLLKKKKPLIKSYSTFEFQRPNFKSHSKSQLFSSASNLLPIPHPRPPINYTTGLFSKEKSITVVRNKGDVDKSLKWDEMVEIFLQAKKPGAHTDDWKDPLWVDFQGLEESDMHKIMEFFGVHHLTVEDIINGDPREKYEEVFDHSYNHIEIDERRYKEYSNVLEDVSLSIVLFKNFILTFHDKPILCVQQVVRMLEYCPNEKIPSSDWVLYALLDGVIDLYTILVDQISKESESLDDLINVLDSVNNQSEIVNRISVANRRANDLYRDVLTKMEILLSLTRDDAPVRRENKIYFQSVYDHVLRMNQKLKLAHDTLGSLNGTFLAKLSLELSISSNQINLIMRTFAAVSVIFLPLTLIAGVFGMNLRIPGQYTDPGGVSLAWFTGVMIFFAVFSVIVLALFKWKKVL